MQNQVTVPHFQLMAFVSDPYKPLQSLQASSFKTAVLFALTSAKRLGEPCHLTSVACYSEVTKTIVCFQRI